MIRDLRIGLVLFLLLAILTGIAYPALVYGVGQAVFPFEANGSLIRKNGAAIGAELIGQNFAAPGHFHGRPSAAGAAGYDAANSSGSNLAPTSAALREALQTRVAALRAQGWQGAIPADLVTASASGLDPHISPESARAQVPRIAAARKLPTAALENLIVTNTEPPTFGLLGDPRVNVLKLNLALDEKTVPSKAAP